MKIPKADQEYKVLFRSVVPSDARVKIRQMFGNEAAFVNGNLFMGLFGNDVFLRLPEEHVRELLKVEGTRPFEPLEGRPMPGYVMLPRAWKIQPALIRTWVALSLRWVVELPAKVPRR